MTGATRYPRRTRNSSSAPRVERTARVEKRVAEIAEPHVAGRQQRLRRFLAPDHVFFEIVETRLVQVEVRIGVVAELEARGEPARDKRDAVGLGRSRGASFPSLTKPMAGIPLATIARTSFSVIAVSSGTPSPGARTPGRSSKVTHISRTGRPGAAAGASRSARPSASRAPSPSAAPTAARLGNARLSPWPAVYKAGPRKRSV